AGGAAGTRLGSYARHCQVPHPHRLAPRRGPDPQRGSRVLFRRLL
ncbi:MAG: hypothetical protein AVDCRST_MAG83-2622, partial [uncultured Arthrobacter sp.]